MSTKRVLVSIIYSVILTPLIGLLLFYCQGAGYLRLCLWAYNIFNIPLLPIYLILGSGFNFIQLILVVPVFVALYIYLILTLFFWIKRKTS